MNNLETKLELFLNEIEMEGYQTGAGLKDEAEFAKIYDKYPGLFTMQTVDDARSLPADRGRDELVSFLTVNVVDEALKDSTDKLMTAELNAEFTTPGGPAPLRSAQVLISNEHDPAGRRALDTARLEAQSELNPMYAEHHERGRELIEGLGFASGADFFEKLENITLESVRAQTEALLTRTEKRYLELLDKYVSALPGKVDKPAQRDMVYMRRAPKFDALFPAEPMVPQTWKTLAAMGIRAEGNPNIRLDIDKRDKKSPRAFCSPVRVPDEVYLVIMPHGGSDDYSSFLHELGHTLHFAYTSASLPMAARFLGDNSVTEAHAGLIERLAVNANWLNHALAAGDYTEYLEYSDFFELYMLRRYSAKLAYEMELHGGRHTLADCAEIYAKTLTTATHVEYSPIDYLRDVDPHFYCVRYLRSWMLERQMRSALEQRFGAEWFQTPGAGEMLLGLWAKGQSEDANAISASLGFSTLDMQPIIDHYTA